MKIIKSAALSATLLLAFPIFANDTLDQEYYSLAESFKDAKNYDKAIEHYQNAIRVNGRHFKAHFGLANILYEKENYLEAFNHYQKAIEIEPQTAQIHYNCGLCLLKLKRTDDALYHFQQATRHKADYAKAYVQLGMLLQDKKQNDQAIAAFEKAVLHDPTLSDINLRLGRMVREQNKFDEAVSYFRAALAQDPKNTTPMLELANTLNMLEFEKARESLELYKKALELSPGLLSALYNYGYTLKKLGHIKEAVEIYDKVIEQKPNYGLARFGRAVSYLMLGDFERGWVEYEWRWAAYDESPKKFDCALWQGEPLNGKKIIVYAEQGLGDTLQFIRYVPVLKEQGAHVIFETQRPLKDLLALCPYIDQLVARGEKVPAADYHIALMSLPLIFKTTINTIPQNIPYIYAKPELVTYWKAKLASDKNFKIGVCWQGNSQYSTQFLRQAVAAKSMSAEQFVPVAQIPNVSLYSLQKVNGTDQLSKLPEGVVINEFGQDFDESHGRFMDTAAIIKCMDLIVTIDTSICHLAGALGVPVWNVLPTPADWRWLIDTNQTPWYANMRLFRQETPGDWNSLMQEVVSEIEKITVPVSRTTPKKPVQRPTPRRTEPVACPTNSVSDPKLSELVQQVSVIDQELSLLEKELFFSGSRVIDAECAQLARRIYYAYNQKEYLNRKIRSLSGK